MARRFEVGFGAVFSEPLHRVGDAVEPSDHIATRNMIKEFSWRLFLVAQSSLAEFESDLGISTMLLVCVLHFSYSNARHNPELRKEALETAGAPQTPLLQRICTVLWTSLNTARQLGTARFARATAVFFSRQWRPLLIELQSTSRIMLLPETLLGAFWPTRTDGTNVDIVLANLKLINQTYECCLEATNDLDMRPISVQPACSDKMESPEVVFADTSVKHGSADSFHIAWEAATGSDPATVISVMETVLSGCLKRVYDILSGEEAGGDVDGVSTLRRTEDLLRRLCWVGVESIVTSHTTTQSIPTEGAMSRLFKGIVACCLEMVCSRILPPSVRSNVSGQLQPP